MGSRYIVAAALALGLATVGAGAGRIGGHGWSAAEVREIGSMSISRLGPPRADPTNRVADDPRAADLGHRLFFDPRLSANGRVSCATCHHPQREFQDGVPLGSGIGTTNRRTMPIAATAYSPFLFWDGSKDSQWAQALGPLESAVEHGGTRAQYVRVVADHYRVEYERLFGALPDLSRIPSAAGPVGDSHARAAWDRLTDGERDAVTAVFVNIGKAIAAYERRIQYGASRFDRYADGLREQGRAPEEVLSADEVAGLRLFIGKAKCIQCHNGPLLTNHEFHNTGVPARPGLARDSGRLVGATAVLKDEFNCRSRWSDAQPKTCPELEFLVSDVEVLERAFKVPSLRKVAGRAPYMHAGQMESLAQVLDHYKRAPAAPAGASELKPLRLSARELRQLEAFLLTLDGGYSTPSHWLGAPQSIDSGDSK